MIEIRNAYGCGNGSSIFVEENPNIQNIFTSPDPVVIQNNRDWTNSDIEEKYMVLAVAYLQHPNPEIRLATISFTDKIDAGILSQVLADLFNDSDPRIPEAVAKAFWTREKKANCEYIVNILKDEIKYPGQVLGSGKAKEALVLLDKYAPDSESRQALHAKIGEELSSELFSGECLVCGDYPNRIWIKTIKYCCPFCETEVMVNESNIVKGRGVNVICNNCQRILAIPDSIWCSKCHNGLINTDEIIRLIAETNHVDIKLLLRPGIPFHMTASELRAILNIVPKSLLSETQHNTPVEENNSVEKQSTEQTTQNICRHCHQKYSSTTDPFSGPYQCPNCGRLLYLEIIPDILIIGFALALYFLGKYLNTLNFIIWTFLGWFCYLLALTFLIWLFRALFGLIKSIFKKDNDQ